MEYPPILTGSTEAQLRALRDYLVRVAQSLDAAAADAETCTTAAAAGGTGTGKTLSDTGAETPEALRAIIVKTADSVSSHIDSITTLLESSYLARSDFGQYAETIETRIEQTAKQTVESYNYTALIRAAEAQLGELSAHLTELQGRIVRGVLTDPEGNLVFGIAISESLTLTGQTVEQNGFAYSVISPGQTFGLYTASGWQFWIRGVKCGWFDARDGMLHAAKLTVEDSLHLGADWQFSAAGGFGIRYIGE